MALSPKNWTLNTYSASTWTPVVTEESILATVLISNTTGADINVQVRITDGASNLCTILPTYPLLASTSEVFDLRSINIMDGQQVEINADATGVEVLASGVINDS